MELPWREYCASREAREPPSAGSIPCWVTGRRIWPRRTAGRFAPPRRVAPKPANPTPGCIGISWPLLH
jgi:uncharacterized iron-regulated membrane protein